MIDLAIASEHYLATLDGRRRAHPLSRTVGAPELGDPVRLREVRDGFATGRAAWARVTYVETLGEGITAVYVLSLDVRMSTDRMPAVKG